MPFTKCPQCGYNEVPEIKTHHAVMNHYVTSDGKRQAVMNRDEKEFDATTGEGKDAVTTKWIRKDIYEAAQKAATNKPVTK